MGVLDGLGKIGGTIVNAGRYVASDGGFSGDITPGYSAANVIKTQAGNIFGGGNKGTVQNVASQGTASQSNQTSPTTGGSGAYDPVADAAAAARAQYGDPAQYDSQIRAYQSQLNSLNPSVGLQNNQDNYQLQLNRLNQNQADADRQYQVGVQQNTQNYQANRTKTLNATRANANALQRLLGMNGAGNSSAATEQAPYAAALQGSQDLNAAQQTFGQNAQNLDLQNSATQRKLREANDDLNTQKYQSDNSVRSQIAQSRAQLLDQIATAQVNRNLANGLTGNAAQAVRNNYQPEIDALNQQVQQLGRGYAAPIQAQTVETVPLTLSDYAQGRQLTAVNEAGPGGNDIQANFLSTLAGGRRDLYGNLIY